MASNDEQTLVYAVKEHERIKKFLKETGSFFFPGILQIDTVKKKSNRYGSEGKRRFHIRLEMEGPPLRGADQAIDGASKQ
jgi:hypothetical protein